jgi:hypothetical protein
MADGDNKFSFVTEGEHELILGNSLNHNVREQEYGFHTVRCEYDDIFWEIANVFFCLPK